MMTNSGETPGDARRAYLALGANLGDRLATLRKAVSSLPNVQAVSAIYETEPIGGPAGQPAYLNAVVEVAWYETPFDLLALCQQLEQEAHRVRVERWGPRTLDVDILLIEGVTLNKPDLQIPHPRMWQRRFVLTPLREIAPHLVTENNLEQAVGDVKCLGPLL